MERDEDAEPEKKLCAPIVDKGLGHFFEGPRSQASLKVASTRHPARLALALHSLNWPDVEAPTLSAAGSALLSEMPRSDICRPADVHAEQTLEDLLSTASAQVSEIPQSPSPPPDQAAVAWAKTEVARGRGCHLGTRIVAPSSQVCNCSERDATWRVIDNGKTGGQNAATPEVERIHTTSNQASLSIALHFRRLFASPSESLQELHQCADDMRRVASCRSRTAG